MVKIISIVKLSIEMNQTLYFLILQFLKNSKNKKLEKKIIGFFFVKL